MTAIHIKYDPLPDMNGNLARCLGCRHLQGVRCGMWDMYVPFYSGPCEYRPRGNEEVKSCREEITR